MKKEDQRQYLKSKIRLAQAAIDKQAHALNNSKQHLVNLEGKLADLEEGIDDGN